MGITVIEERLEIGFKDGSRLVITPGGDITVRMLRRLYKEILRAFEYEKTVPFSGEYGDERVLIPDLSSVLYVVLARA